MSGGSKKQTVGYKYSLGAHMGFCHGPIDKVTRIRVADRVAWTGESTGGQITISEPNLFGGEDREGGISGLVDFEFGEPAQDVNDYLQAKQNVSGETVPAYRGIAAAVLRQVYLGTNPYLKPWEFRAQRIHTSTRGAVQWYDQKSETGIEIIEESTLPLFISDITYGGAGVDYDGSVVRKLDSVGSTSTAFNMRRRTYDLFGNLQSTDLFDIQKLDNHSNTSLILFKNSAEYTAQRKNAAGSGDVTGWFQDASLLSRPIRPPIGNNNYYSVSGNISEFPGPVYANGNFYSIGSNSTGSQVFLTAWLAGSSNPFAYYELSANNRIGLASDCNGGIWIWSSEIGKVLEFDENLNLLNEYTGNVPSTARIAVYDNYIAYTLVADSAIYVVRAEGGVLTPVGTNPTNVSYGLLTGLCDGYFTWDSNKLYRIIASIGVANGDMNPAHIIRECLTDTNWGLGYTASDIDDTAFTLAADTLFNEEFGISLLWSQQSPIEDFIRDVLRHIDGVLYVDPRTGKFTLKLIRDDYVAASLPILDESNIISISDYKKPTIGELTNYVTVKYWDRSTSEDSAISVQDIALAQQQGSVVSADVPMPGITRGALASRVASRELAALSNPLITCTIIANREAASLNIGDAFKLTWPKFGLSETIMRVTNAQFGTLQDGRVKIECVQDVFGLPQAVFSEPTDSNFVNPTNAPANSPFRLIQEANYWTLIQDQGEDFTFDPLDGYLLTAATTPSADALNYRIWTDESGSYVEKEPADFCPTATITHDFPRVVNGVIQTVVGISGLDADDVADIDIGSIAQIGNEFMEVVSVSTTSLTVGRAVVDTPIEDHVSGDRIFFWGNSFYGFSATLYQDNDTIGVKITPATAQGQLDVVDATEQTLTFDQRAYRAWLPGNLAIGGSYFPSSVEGVETVDSSWAHRDRTLQTAGLNDFTEASIGPEVGTTYTTTLTRVNTSAQLDQNTGLTGTTDSLDPAGYDGLVRFGIVSVRDALDSYHTHSHEFIVTRTSALQEEQGLFLFTEDNEAIITES